MNWIAAFGVALLLAGIPPARAPSSHSIFDNDRRLTRTIALPRRPPEEKLTLGALLGELGRQLGVDLLVQGPALGQEVSPEFAGHTGKEILTAIGISMQHRWTQEHGVYVLVPMSQAEKEAQALQRDQEEPQIERALVASFSPQQRVELQEGGQLGFDQLNPRQRQLFLRALQWCASDFGGALSVSALAGQGGQVALVPVFNGADLDRTTPHNWEVHLQVPMYDKGTGTIYPQPFAQLPPDMSPDLVGKPPRRGTRQ